MYVCMSVLPATSLNNQCLTLTPEPPFPALKATAAKWFGVATWFGSLTAGSVDLPFSTTAREWITGPDFTADKILRAAVVAVVPLLVASGAPLLAPDS